MADGQKEVSNVNTDSQTWSDYQQAIFADIAEGTGHTAIRARAGSGKTTTIVAGLKSVPKGKSTLFVAFNKSIAEELKTRAPSNVEVSTLHSYGYKAVMHAFGRVRLDKQRVVEIVKASMFKLFDASLKGLRAQEAKDLKRTLISYAFETAKGVSLAKGTLAATVDDVNAIVDAHALDGPSVAATLDRDFAADVLKFMNDCKDVSSGVIDFDDMIWLPVVLNLNVMKFDRVFVDETQDLNACQIKLVLGACKKQGRICAVGDDRQAIYTFRGADENAFQRVVDGLDAKVMPLSVTYRCGKLIVAEALALIPDLGLQAADDAHDGVVTRSHTIETMMTEVGPGDFILSRTNAPLVSICLRMLKDGRRACIQGRDIAEGLLSFVKRSGAFSVEALRNFIDKWEAAEIDRLMAKGHDAQAVVDKAECLMVMSEGASSVDDVVTRIERLFSNVDDHEKVVLSTTHKAKGLERDRVFMLRDTYLNRPGVEEQNLYYVCITRARRELHFVSGGTKKRKAVDSVS